MSANQPAREYSANDTVIRFEHNDENCAIALDLAVADAFAADLATSNDRPEHVANATANVLIAAVWRANDLPRAVPL